MRSPAGRPGDSRANSFDTLRLVGAATVLVSHSFALTGHSQPGIGRNTLGTLGVLMFFGISGFLITRSWLREPRLGTFLAKRALRLLPALFVVVLACALVLGPLVTTLPTSRYLASAATWKFAAGNAILKTEYFLPGVFRSNPLPGVVDGSVWTLPHEAHAYIVVAALGALTLLGRRRLLGMAGFLVVIGLATRFSSGVEGVGDPSFLSAFACGAALYLWRESVMWNGVIAAVALAIAVALSHTAAAGLSMAIAIPYLAVYVAYLTPNFGRTITRHGDFSYGLYIWAFPIQQLIVHLWRSITTLELLLLAGPVTFLMGVCSWKLVESRALRLKRRLPGAHPDDRPVLGQLVTGSPNTGLTPAAPVPGREA